MEVINNMSTDNNWKNDPRLKGISSEKLDALTNIISGSKGLKNDAIIPFFLRQTAEASSKGINFSDAETELIIDVLKTDMTPEQIKRIDMVKKMAQMLNKQRR